MHACVLVADDGEIYELLNRFARYDEDEEKPDALWDYFGIGGRFEGALPLKKRRLRRFLGVIPVGWSSEASIARKYEVDCDRFLHDAPVVGLYFRGELHMCPFTLTDDAAIASWQQKFRLMFAEIPEDSTLRIIDAHS